MNIYLDIDGVLLANSVQAAYFADDFLQYILKHWPDNTYWLTTHCWRGENRAAEVLLPVLKPDTAKLLKLIKPTDWNTEKTDGIDFLTPFLWFDDDLFPEEEKVLRSFDAFGCWRQVDLSRDPNQLIDEVAYLKSLA